MIVNNILETVGNTPLIKLNRLKEQLGLKADLYAKVEFFNPGGSIKDRIALNMVEKAVEEGDITKDATLIEPTSGNTGIGMAMVAAALGMKCILIMPETMSIERRKLIEHYGAQLILTEGALGMNGAIMKANELKEQIPNSYILSQFENPNNPITHLEKTGIEILNDLRSIHCFVAGIGTGGTISGVGKVLKNANHNIKVIGVEPAESPFITEGRKGPHKIQGIGAGFVPMNYDPNVVDEVLTVKSDDAIDTAKMICKNEGLLVGISSGAALKIAIDLAKKDEYAGKNIVVLLPDTGERYLSTELFD
ncbi:MAG: cysteine synthase A [Anaerorhabdus sp.]|uniref:cysteine synthase A n=1 Tax=Anaerorhabdus sp. TaxID=1872524 RepID=UPI003A8A6D00